MHLLCLDSLLSPLLPRDLAITSLEDSKTPAPHNTLLWEFLHSTIGGTLPPLWENPGPVMQGNAFTSSGSLHQQTPEERNLDIILTHHPSQEHRQGWEWVLELCCARFRPEHRKLPCTVKPLFRLTLLLLQILIKWESSFKILKK